MVHIAYLPKLLGGVLARYALEDLRAAGMLIDEVGYIVDIAIDNDVEALISSVVGGNVGGSE
jgi:hypothetical protein